MGQKTYYLWAQQLQGEPYFFLEETLDPTTHLPVSNEVAMQRAVTLQHTPVQEGGYFDVMVHERDLDQDPLHSDPEGIVIIMNEEGQRIDPDTLLPIKAPQPTIPTTPIGLGLNGLIGQQTGIAINIEDLTGLVGTETDNPIPVP